MATDPKRWIKVGAIVIALFFAIAFLGNKFGFLGSIVGTGDGYFIYGQSDVDFTNKTCSPTAPPASGADNGESCNAAFYSWTGSQCGLSGSGGCGKSWSITGSDTDIALSSSGGQYGTLGQSPEIQTKEDFASRDVRADIDATYSGLYGFTTGQSISISSSAEGVLASESFSSQGSGSTSFSGSLELKRKVFSNTTDVYWKGLLVKTYPTPASEKLIFSVNANQGSITASVKNLRYLPTYSCQLGPNDLLGFESFSGGITDGLTLQPSVCTNSTISCPRYPVKSFCLAHPAILTDSAKNGSLSTAEPYQILLGGGTVPVTQTQTLSVFYVIDNSQGLIPTQCSVTQAYGVNNGTCTDLTGIVQICSQGILDSTTGLCVVQPSISCTNGTYNSQTNQCEVVPPSGVSCSAYGSSYTYNSQTGVCESTPTSVTTCTNGRLDLQTNTCIYNPPVSKQCTQGTYNNATNQCEFRIEATCPSGLTYDSATQSCKGQPTYASAQNVSATAPAPKLAGSTAVTSFAAGGLFGVSWLGPWSALFAFVFLLALLWFIFFAGSSGRRRWEKFKTWLDKNKEGILIGLLIANAILFFQFYPIYWIPIIGGILEFLRQSYPIWVVWFIITLLGMIFGALVDWRYKPNK